MNAPARTIVIVDDEEYVRRALARDFRYIGYNTIAVATGEEGIAAIIDARPVGVVVDLYVDGYADGVQLVDRIQRIDPDLPVVVLTGKGSIATAVDAMRRGAVGYLEKPVRAAQIVEALSDDAPAATVEPEPTALLPLAHVEWEHIQRALAACDYNATKAAQALGVSRKTLHRRLRASK